MLSTTAARTKQNLALAGISASTFGRVVGVPPSSMRAAMAGEMKLDGPTEAQHYEISCRLLRLIESLKPLCCDEAEVLCTMLDKDFERIQALVIEITTKE